MEGRLLAGVALLLLYALAFTPTVEGQCAITAATIQIDEDMRNGNQFRDRSALSVVLDGITTGALYTSITWTRNTTTLSSNSQTFIGGGDVLQGGNPCEDRMYRPAILLTGYQPGVYQYSVTNAQTSGDVTSPTLTISDSGPPSNLMLTQVSGRSVQASWTAPSNDVVDYRVFVNDASVNGDDSGPPSNLILTQVNGRRVQASWAAPSNPVVDYRVFVNDPSVNGDGIVVASGTTTLTTSQFGADTTVTIRVRATATYWSEVAAIESITVRALLSPGVTPSSTTTSVTLTLTQPTNSLPANQYTATLTSSACTNIPTRMGTSTTGSVMISNLEAGIRYVVRVTATNTATGLTSTTTTAVTTQEAGCREVGGLISYATTTVTTQEESPTGTSGIPSRINSSPTSIELTWTNIECLQQNGILTNFTIRYRQQGSTQDINTQTVATSFNVTGLLAFTTYIFSVAGSNRIGMGVFSAKAYFRTAEDSPTMVRNLVGNPQLFTIDLTWDVPTQLNGIIIQYTILYSVNGSALIRRTTTLTTFVIIDLNPNTRVSNITVYATTGVGDGPFVMLQSAIITFDRPHNCILGNSALTSGINPSRLSSGCNSNQVKEDVLLDALYLLWSEFGVNPLGQVEACPAMCCAEVSQPGLYWIRNGTEVVQQYCY